MEREFQPGVVVSLKSGGPLMTVANVRSGMVHCTHFDWDNIKLVNTAHQPEQLLLASEESVKAARQCWTQRLKW